jgi:hypothetical protein
VPASRAGTWTEEDNTVLLLAKSAGLKYQQIADVSFSLSYSGRAFLISLAIMLIFSCFVFFWLNKVSEPLFRLGLETLKLPDANTS